MQPTTMFSGRVAAALGLCAALATAAACTSERPKPSPSADPLAAAVAAEMSRTTADEKIRAIIVEVVGRTRFERYYASSADQYRSIFSVTKSVTSTLVGIAIDEGRLHLDDRLDQMLPRQAARMTPQVARVTLRELLTMTGGFPDTWNGAAMDALASAPNWTRYILTHQDQDTPALFHYSDYGAHLLSPILVQATGQSVLAYARAKLFDPLGIPTRPAAEPVPDDAHLAEYLRAQFAWPVDPQGFHTGYANLKLRPRDMARIGELFLQNGRWRDKQLLSAGWVRQATASQAGKAFDLAFQGFRAFDPRNYGYLWWVDTVDAADAYFAWGYGGQLIEVVPARQLVIVVSTDVDFTNPNALTVSPDNAQRLVDVIAPLAR
jgi:CubicO group peptidase (beta-lactamase class C family)